MNDLFQNTPQKTQKTPDIRLTSLPSEQTERETNTETINKGENMNKRNVTFSPRADDSFSENVKSMVDVISH